VNSVLSTVHGGESSNDRHVVGAWHPDGMDAFLGSWIPAIHARITLAVAFQAIASFYSFILCASNPATNGLQYAPTVF
jgi:hypothetical protein